MSREILRTLFPNAPLKYLGPHRRALAEACLENHPQSLDPSEISELSAISHACRDAEPTLAATERKFSEKLPIPARNVSRERRRL